MLQIEEFEKEVKRGLPNTVYLCYTTEPFFLSEASKLIREKFNSISIETYESLEELNVSTLALETSLFAEKRILLIYNFEKIKKPEKRLNFIKKITEINTSAVKIIILCNASLKDISQEIDILKKNKNCAIFNLSLSERELPLWIKHRASREGINLSPDAIYYLIEITGGLPGLISSEIEKLAILTDKTNISVFDIKDILTETGENTVFDLIEAINKKDIQNAFRILRNLDSVEPDQILGALNWFYSNRAQGDMKVFELLYRTNLSLRQARLCSLELLIYELLKS